MGAYNYYPVTMAGIGSIGTNRFPFYPKTTQHYTRLDEKSVQLPYIIMFNYRPHSPTHNIIKL